MRSRTMIGIATLCCAAGLPIRSSSQSLPDTVLSPAFLPLSTAQPEQRSARFVRELEQLDRQQLVAEQEVKLLLLAARPAQSRNQQGYLQRMRPQQRQLVIDRNHRADVAPIFAEAPIYSYLRGRDRYTTNEYGAALLRLAVNVGYAEGVLTGQADHSDRWPSSFRTAYAYLDASNGFTGLYIGRDEYAYYFREGFERGYDDGFTDGSVFGRSSGSTYLVDGYTMEKILDLRALPPMAN